MPEILRRPEAEADLDEIWLYIATDSIANADGFIDLIEERCQLLAENPQMGRARPEFAPDLRSFPMGAYLIFYRPLDNGIEVVRVVSGNRNLEPLF